MHKKTKQKPEACTHTYPHTVCKKTPPVYIHPLTPNLLHYMLASTFYLHPSAYSISNHSAVQNVILYKQSWWQWSASKVFYISVSSFQCAVYNNKIYKTAKTARNNHQIWPRPRLCKVACAFSPTLIYRLLQLLEYQYRVLKTLFNQIWLNTSLLPFLGDIDHPYAKFISTDSPEHTATEDNHTKTELCSHRSEYVKCLLNNEYVRQRACLPRTSLLL